MTKETLGICTGSFDPITMGHIDIIQRASKIFDKVIVLISVNTFKDHIFTVEERVELIKKSTNHIKNISVDFYEGLTAHYFEKVKATALIRGLRAITDFEYEFQMSLVNKKINKSVETVYLNTSLENLYISSSLVKEVAMFGGDISAFVPPEILKEVERRLKKERKV